MSQPYDLNNEETLIHKQLKRAQADLQKAMKEKDPDKIAYFAEEVESWQESLRQLPAINWLGLLQD